jgi:hypothetical protein
MLSKLLKAMLERGCGNTTIRNFFLNLAATPEYYCRGVDPIIDNTAKTLVKYRR